MEVHMDVGTAIVLINGVTLVFVIAHVKNHWSN